MPNYSLQLTVAGVSEASPYEHWRGLNMSAGHRSSLVSEIYGRLQVAALRQNRPALGGRLQPLITHLGHLSSQGGREVAARRMAEMRWCFLSLAGLGPGVYRRSSECTDMLSAGN
jgi:hypothetical protein